MFEDPSITVVSHLPCSIHQNPLFASLQVLYCIDGNCQRVHDAACRKNTSQRTDEGGCDLVFVSKDWI